MRHIVPMKSLRSLILGNSLFGGGGGCVVLCWERYGDSGILISSTVTLDNFMHPLPYQRLSQTKVHTRAFGLLDPPLSPVSIIINTVESVHLRFANFHEYFYSTLYFCQKSRLSFHLNVHALLKLPNRSKYVPFDSVKHLFQPYLADQTWSFRKHKNKHNCTQPCGRCTMGLSSFTKDRAAHCISPTRLSAVMFDGKSQMHTLYCRHLYTSILMNKYWWIKCLNCT